MEVIRIDWPRILLDLRMADWPTRKVARELDLPRGSVQALMYGCEPRYSVGDALVRLHKEICVADMDDIATTQITT